MWWEFKLILSAVVVFMAAFFWQLHDFGYGIERRTRIFGSIAIICGAVILFSVLWLIWGPSHGFGLNDWIEKP